MPNDLPGFYWDAERNRYFPASSKPPVEPAAALPAPPLKKRKIAEDSEDQNGTRRMHPWLLAQSAATLPSWDWAKRDRIMRGILSVNIGATDRLNYNYAPTFGKITTFCTYRGGDPHSNSTLRWHLLGDSQGWLFRCTCAYLDHETSGEPPRLDSDIDVDVNWLPWRPELNLQPNGSVSSISMWGSRWVATGTSARFASSEIRSLDRMFIVTLPEARDLWASSLRERAVAFGASFRAIYMPDIDHSTSPEQLYTQSDVFTVVQDQNLIYTGSRNGSIHRFDKRVGFKQRGDLLLDSRFIAERSSVLNLTLLGGANDDPSSDGTAVPSTLESGLFVSQMNGQLQTFDLRFVSSMRATQPVVLYHGHVNTHTRELGLAIDFQNAFIYAAGQDCRIRGWSLGSGAPIVASPSPPSATTSTTWSQSQTTPMIPFPTAPTMALPLTEPAMRPKTPAWAHFNPFLTQFSDPIPVLRVSSDDGNSQYHHASGSSHSDSDSEGKGKPGGGGEMICLWAASGADLWKWNLGQHNYNYVA